MEEERNVLLHKILYYNPPTFVHCIISFLYGYIIGYLVHEMSIGSNKEHSLLFKVYVYIITFLFGWFVVGCFLMEKLWKPVLTWYFNRTENQQNNI